MDDIYLQLFDSSSDEDVLESVCNARKVPAAVYCAADDEGR